MRTQHASSCHEAASWHRENRAAYRYRVFSDAESGTVRQVLYLDMAAHGESQAQLWHREARKTGVALPDRWAPGMLDMAGYGLVQVLGPRWAGWLLWSLAVPGFALYGRFHHRGLERVLSGVADGLVTNACLVFGVAGMTPERGALAMAGLLGLLFGAGMAGVGDWLAMGRRHARLGRSGVPADHLRAGEEASLMALLTKRGMSESRALRAIRALHEDPERAMRHLPLAAGELDPPQGAAMVGLLSFAAGALVPLLGLYPTAEEWAVPFAAGVSALALWGVGMKRAVLAGAPAVRGGFEALLLGSAGALTAWGLGWGLAKYV